MTEIKEKAKDAVHEAEKIVEAAAKDEPETNKEARRRQRWMPLVGSVLAALILFAILGYYMGWF